MQADLMARSFEARIGDAEKLKDPIARELAAQALVDELESMRCRIADLRAHAALEAHEDGRTFRAIAEEVGLEHPVVQHHIGEGRKLRSGEKPAWDDPARRRAGRPRK